jgi:spermidine synthase
MCIELSITFFALLIPCFLKGADSAYIFLFQSSAPSPPVVPALHIIISPVLLAVPTICIGTTLPILSSMVVRSAAFTGWETGILYSVNTFGALVGVSVTGFYTIRLLGVYPAYFIFLRRFFRPRRPGRQSPISRYRRRLESASYSKPLRVGPRESRR